MKTSASYSYEALAQDVRFARTKKGWSVTTLCKIAKVTNRTLTRVENNHLKGSFNVTSRKALIGVAQTLMRILHTLEIPDPLQKLLSLDLPSDEATWQIAISNRGRFSSDPLLSQPLTEDDLKFLQQTRAGLKDMTIGFALELLRLRK